MRLVILGSSSAGNCYLLDNGSECLMVECGMPFKDVQKSVNFDVRRIVGVVISHEHKDHCREVQRCLAARIPVYCSQGTAQALHLSGEHLVHQVSSHVKVKIGSFRLLPFETQHDAAEPFGFLISHPECGTVLFATDTYYLRNRFKHLNNIMIECNYRHDILNENVDCGVISAPQYARTIKSHMSYETCVETLLANDLSEVNNIVLLHLSNDNADAAFFTQSIREATGKRVTVARRGIVIENFNKSPF